jgi:CheY-like chemotaxis protein
MPTTSDRRPEILVVDDDRFIRRSLAAILDDRGFDVATAPDADACLAALESTRPDVILLDVMMPGRDGFEACRALKAEPRFASIPIVLLSAGSSPRDRDRALASGAVDYLTKPCAPSELVERLREILNPS